MDNSNAKKIFNVSLVLLVVAAGLWAWQELHKPSTFPIKRVKIEGIYAHVGRTTLRQKLMPFVHTGFFALDMQALRNVALEFPWIASASIYRVWPDTVVLRVTEQKPVAHWGDVGLLNEAGQLFKPINRDVPADLPTFLGPPGRESELMFHYLAIQKTLHHIGLSVSELRLTPRMAWSMKLNNGMVVRLGREDTAARLGRFVGVYQAIFGSKGSEAVEADLRYPNGIAVKWKKNS